MPLYDTIVKNGLVVTASDRGHYDIAIKAGKIVRLEAYLDDEDAEQVIDAEGGMVMPGGIDAHVHLSQDLETSEGVIGLRCADNFETGSRSGVCGGTTTMISFAQQLRNDTSLLAVVNAYDARAKATGSYVDYAYHVVVSNPTPEILETEFPQLVERGITSIKLFMTYDSLRLSDSQLLDVMLAGRRHGITILLHAENGDVIEWLTDKLEKQGMLAPIYHTHSRPQIVETEAVSRAILLAELVQTPLVLGHVSASGAARAIREAQDRDLPIFGETCPQYLFLTHDDLTKFAPPNAFDNSKYVCSPPPGSDDRDQEAIWTGLRNGTFTLFSSNHCPYVYDDPEGSGLDLTTSLVEGESPPPAGGEELAAWASDKEGNFRYIPNSCPGIETRLPLLFSKGVETGRISAEKFVELTSTNVAKLYGLYPKKGSLQPGSDADIVIWNPQCATEPFSINHGNLHSAVGYTPYEGQCLQNWPRWTIVRGKIIFAEGELVEKGPGHGKFVKRGKSQLGKEVRGGDLEKDIRRVAAWLDI